MYTHVSKLILTLLSYNKSIHFPIDFCMHSEGQDSPLTKLTNTIKGTYKFRMEIPDTMINDAFKKSAGYSTTKPRKQKMRKQDLLLSLADNIVEEPVAVELVKSISIEEQQHQQCPVVEDPAVQSLLDLRKGSKASRLKSLKQAKQAVGGEGSSVAHKKYYEFENILATDSDASQDFHSYPFINSTHDNRILLYDRYGGENIEKIKDARKPSSRSLRKDKSHVVPAQKDTHANQHQDQEDVYVQNHPNPGWFTKKSCQQMLREEQHVVFTESEWNVGEGDVSKPRSFEIHMSKSIKPHPSFYNNDFYHLVLKICPRRWSKENELDQGNKRLKGRDWNNKDVKRSTQMMDKIDQVMKRREQLRRFKEYVGRRPKTIDPRSYVRPM
ncbi:hypothetical protein Tco_0102790 [Tanacetum coccineum]